MTDAEMIAAFADKLSKEELMALASRLKRKKPEALVPTEEERAQFERLWNLRKTFTKRPGDPKQDALMKYCRKMREKPAPIEEIEHGIRMEYGGKRERPDLYCQMVTFMSQRRWENYDYAAAKAAKERAQSNVVPIAPSKRPAWLVEFERQRAGGVA